MPLLQILNITQPLPAFASAQAGWHAGVIASDPYDALDDLLPAGAAAADLNLSNVFTLRRAAGNRLVTSVLAPALLNSDAGMAATPFMRKFRRLFPDFPEPRWRHLHYGKIGLSRDLMPRMCQHWAQCLDRFWLLRNRDQLCPAVWPVSRRTGAIKWPRRDGLAG